MALTQENAQGQFRLEKDDSGAWMLPEETPVRPLNQAKVQSLIRRVASLRMLHPLGKRGFGVIRLRNPGRGVDYPDVR